MEILNISLSCILGVLWHVYRKFHLSMAQNNLWNDRFSQVLWTLTIFDTLHHRGMGSYPPWTAFSWFSPLIFTRPHLRKLNIDLANLLFYFQNRSFEIAEFVDEVHFGFIRTHVLNFSDEDRWGHLAVLQNRFYISGLHHNAWLTSRLSICDMYTTQCTQHF